MKTKVKELEYDQVCQIKPKGKFTPKKPGLFWRNLIKLLAKGDLKSTNFTHTMICMEKLPKDQPCLILMNHSCFLDLEIAETVMYPRPFNIICTSDGFVGKEGLMKNIGCIPTNKFVADYAMVRNMKYCFDILKTSVLMYPEASYSFDGTATPLPETLGKCLKLMNVPVVMIRTYGAFTHNPLYNNLQKRKVDVSAQIKYLLSPEEIQQKSVEELNQILKDEFTFDSFKWQQENNVTVSEPFRADSLNRVLYKCCICGKEGMMEGKGIHLTCHNCNANWELTETGFLERTQAGDATLTDTDASCGSQYATLAKPDAPHRSQPSPSPAQASFTHIPDWYNWQRQQVVEEIQNGTYRIESEVDICMLVDFKSIYKVGSGHLTHSKEGFTLTGCNGQLNYTQKPKSSYSLYSDYYWYELGDIICIGDNKKLFYCFPKGNTDIVAKARIATEELFKLNK